MKSTHRFSIDPEKAGIIEMLEMNKNRFIKKTAWNTSLFNLGRKIGKAPENNQFKFTLPKYNENESVYTQSNNSPEEEFVKDFIYNMMRRFRLK